MSQDYHVLSQSDSHRLELAENAEDTIDNLIDVIDSAN